VRRVSSRITILERAGFNLMRGLVGRIPCEMALMGKSELLIMAEEDRVRAQLCKLDIDMSRGPGEVYQSSRGRQPMSL